MATYIGDVLYVAKAIPATNDTAGFEALTWVKVKGIQLLPTLAVKHATIDRDDLESGFTGVLKGMASGTESQIAYYDISGDTGQADLKIQSYNSVGELSVKIVRKPSGTGGIPAAGDNVEYAQGVVYDYTPTDNNGSTLVGASVTFRADAAPVYSTEP